MNERTVATSTSDSFQATVSPNVVVIILRETANNIISRYNSTSSGIASARRETTRSI